MNGTELAAVIVATGALGTAAFGIVENLKGTPLGEWGFGKIRELLGVLFTALRQVYGAGYEELLKAQYREGRTAGQFVKTLRQGVRVGLTTENAANFAKFVGLAVVSAEDLERIAERQATGKELDDSERRILARFELAVDARIDAALSLANSSYIAAMRAFASIAAIAIALIAGWLIIKGTPSPGLSESDIMLRALLIGVAAVPFAPIAKDLSRSFTAADKAIRGKS